MMLQANLPSTICVMKRPNLCLKGLSHEIFMGFFWLECIYLGLNGNRLWFLNIKDDSSILDSYFKY
jgi:hypothetical protein